MKKTLLVLAGMMALNAFAHDVWVVNHQGKVGEKLRADLAYSHEFPYAEEIAKDRVHIFKPLQLHTQDGSGVKTIPMKNEGKNYEYISADKLAAGNYWVSAIYQPTFWSKNANGWKQQNMKEMTDATYCEQSSMYGKMYEQIGDVKSDFYKTPLGLDLEIIPLDNPKNIEIGKPFQLQVLYEGKPLAGATLVGTSDTFVIKDMEAERDHREPQAFSGKTDKSGKVNLIPLINGFWKIKVNHKTDFSDAKTCQNKSVYSTLSMEIGDAHAGHSHGHNHSHDHSHEGHNHKH